MLYSPLLGALIRITLIVSRKFLETCFLNNREVNWFSKMTFFLLSSDSALELRRKKRKKERIELNSKAQLELEAIVFFGF